jgi:hypothetical protein
MASFSLTWAQKLLLLRDTKKLFLEKLTFLITELGRFASRL